MKTVYNPAFWWSNLLVQRHQPPMTGIFSDTALWQLRPSQVVAGRRWDEVLKRWLNICLFIGYDLLIGFMVFKICLFILAWIFLQHFVTHISYSNSYSMALEQFVFDSLPCCCFR